MNFERLSKKAVSYSSASMTKCGPEPSRPGVPSWGAIPPMSQPGFRPVFSRIQATRLDTVVLPWVPATAITWRPRSACRASQDGPDS